MHDTRAAYPPPKNGTPIAVIEGQLRVPSDPIIPFIEGDGIGPDIWEATRRVIDAAITHVYDGERKIAWHEVYAGEKAQERRGE